MKKILILYPHFPPSNLAGVHRPRLFAQHLPFFGWEPIILTVHEKYYEEVLDRKLEKLLPINLRIVKVDSFKISKPRLIGDIGLRAFFHLYKKAKNLILSEKIDFLYIPIPSFYCALLGRWLHQSTKIKYGIDYIDPWVHQFPGSNVLFSRHWLSTKVAQFLEPIAVKKASLITGVAEGYYKGVAERNPHLLKQAFFGAMPYGGEVEDHKYLSGINAKPYLFNKKAGVIQLVYAGAMLPKAYKPLERIFKSIAENKEAFTQIEFHFIGTGVVRNGLTVNTIKPLAEAYGIWETIVFEHPSRIPYLDVLTHLNNADGIFVLGSTEPHYTPSKVYQAVLSAKPIFAILHKNSLANEVIVNSNAGVVLAFNGEDDLNNISVNFGATFQKFLNFYNTFSAQNVNTIMFESSSALSVTKLLAELLNKCTIPNLI